MSIYLSTQFSVGDIQKDINRLPYLQEDIQNNYQRTNLAKEQILTYPCPLNCTKFILWQFPGSLEKKLYGFIPSIRVKQTLQGLTESCFILTEKSF